MIRDVSRSSLLLPFVAALAAACDGDSGTGPEPVTTVVPEVRTEDPRGDTFGSEMSAGLVQPDIVRLTVTRETAALVLVVEFADPVVAEPESPNAAVGLIDLDTDRNAATGAPAATDAFRPPGTGSSGLGVDVGVAVAPDGEVMVIDIEAETRRALRATYSGRTIAIRLPHALIGGDGEVNLAAVFGTVPEPTDVAPDSGHLAVPAAGATRTTGAVVDPAAGETGTWAPGWGRP